MTQPHHRNRHPKYRKLYKIQNWQDYERSLIQRGDLTIWLSEDVIQSWYDDSLNQLGRPKFYSNVAIETALTLRLLFKLPLRQTEVVSYFDIHADECRAQGARSHNLISEKSITEN